MMKRELVLGWQKDPVKFFKRHWPDIYLWPKLVEISYAIKDNRRVVVPSGHGIGKTWLMARIVLWFLFSHQPAKVITTAPTWNQVEKLLWSEISKSHSSSKYPLGGRLLLTNLKIEDEWFATGFSTTGTNSEREFGAPKFQGYHSPNMLVVLDEGPGVDHAIWLAAETLITGANNKIVAIGNPTSPTGDFYEACKSPLWHKVEVSSFDHPNVQQNKIIVPGAVTLDWIEERRQEWGEDTPLWNAKILGKFPIEGTDTLIPLSWAEQCIGLGLKQEGEKKLGIDVARFGDDKTVFATMVGKVILPLEKYQKKDTSFTIGRTKVLHKQQEFEVIGVDDTGVGGGVTDALQEEDDISVEPVNFGESAIEPEMFENKRAEIFWNLREMLKNKEIELPDDKELVNQLSSIKYKYNRRGRIVIESKDDMKKRGLKSPDDADAVAIVVNLGYQKKAERLMTLIHIDKDEEDNW